MVVLFSSRKLKPLFLHPRFEWTSFLPRLSSAQERERSNGENVLLQSVLQLLKDQPSGVVDARSRSHDEREHELFTYTVSNEDNSTAVQQRGQQEATQRAERLVPFLSPIFSIPNNFQRKMPNIPTKCYIMYSRQNCHLIHNTCYRNVDNYC